MVSKKVVRRSAYTLKGTSPKLRNEGAKKEVSKIPKLSPIQKAEINALAGAMEIKLNKCKVGFSAGILWALLVLLVTVFSSHFPTWYQLMSECYGMLGYSASGGGIILGPIYGFIDGFVLGFVFAWIYNKLLRRC